jgi:hypothetical protein
MFVPFDIFQITNMHIKVKLHIAIPKMFNLIKKKKQQHSNQGKKYIFASIAQFCPEIVKFLVLFILIYFSSIVLGRNKLIETLLNRICS